MHHSWIAGRVLASTVPLPELRPATPPAELSFSIGQVPDEPGEELRRYEIDDELWLTISAASTGWIFDFPAYATFFAHHDGAVIAQPQEGVAMRTVRHLLIDQVIPLFLVLGGRTVLHASAVGIRAAGEMRAVLFLGDSGAGKSTTAHGCRNAGATLLADDFALVEFPDGVPHLVPAGVGVRLWGDVAALAAPGDVELPVAHYHDKKRLVSHLEGPTETQDAVCIAAVVWLGRRGESQARQPTSVAPSEAVVRIIEQCFRPDVNSADANWRSLDRATRIVESVGVVEAALPADLANLTDHCRELLADVLDAQSLRGRSA